MSALYWLCGMERRKEGDDYPLTPPAPEPSNSSLEEKPRLRTIVDINLIICLSVTVFIIGYWAWKGCDTLNGHMVCWVGKISVQSFSSTFYFAAKTDKVKWQMSKLWHYLWHCCLPCITCEWIMPKSSHLYYLKTFGILATNMERMTFSDIAFWYESFQIHFSLETNWQW